MDVRVLSGSVKDRLFNRPIGCDAWPATRCCHIAALLVLLALFIGTSVSHGQSQTARLGAAVAILADGSEPWEDRPIAVEGIGVIPGTAGVSDPGDDLGPSDGIVRTYDTVAIRLSYDVLDASAKSLVLTARLDSELVWELNEDSRLRLEGCPGGATVNSSRSTLKCRIGDVAVPPAVTGVVDAVARVRGSAPNGSRPSVALSVTSVNGSPDADPVRCPVPVFNGCWAYSPSVRVSAALGLETSKRLYRTPVSTTRAGVPGWDVGWQLDVLVGGDGDPRGDAVPEPGPFELHDWWSATTPDGHAASVAATLVKCDSRRAVWQCAQADGPGTPVEITLDQLDPEAWLPTQSGQLIVDRRRDAKIGSVIVTMFYPTGDVEAAGGNVRVRNCFATEPWDETVAEFVPRAVGGEPNLGGLSEPLANNCAARDLVVKGKLPCKLPSVDKNYLPGSDYVLWEVVPGEVIATSVQVRNQNPIEYGEYEYRDVIACDAFDNAAQELVVHTPRGESSAKAAWAVAVDPDGTERNLVQSEVFLEFAAGEWGTWVPEGESAGEAHYKQSRGVCTDDAPVNAEGWVRASDLDFGNAGAGLLDADEVNLVRARFRDPVPPGAKRVLYSHVLIKPNRPGTLVLNYGSGYASSEGGQHWDVGYCWGRRDSVCPEPPQLDSSTFDPGPQGDARIVVEAPTQITKYVDDSYRATKRAGQTVRYRLEIMVDRNSTFPVPDNLVATGVVVTDVLSSGLAHIPGRAVRLGEDTNGNGRLDVGEDVNGNGVLDHTSPAPPDVRNDEPDRGQTTLVWQLGDIVSGASRPLVVEYVAQVGELVPGGRSLLNTASVQALHEPPPSPCNRYSWRCDQAWVNVANTSRAGVEKTALNATVERGQAVHFRLRAANLTQRPIEWLDAVDLLPWHGDPRTPQTRMSSTWQAITSTVSAGPAAVETWASSRPPADLDIAASGLPDGDVDPVTVYGRPGAGLRAADWPCLLEEVGTADCPQITTHAEVTALRFWAPDPDPTASGTGDTSFLPVDHDPREIDLWLEPVDSRPGDVFHNTWGGRFEGLTLPAFNGSVARAAVPRLYLPVALREPCVPRPVSLVVVLDASSSMRRPSGLGGTKMEAVVIAAGQLVDILFADPHGHEIAVVGFNNTAWTAQVLSRDASAVRSALAGLTDMTAEGTRLDLGIETGAKALSHAAYERRTMVFLTDGLPNRVPLGPGGSQEETVLAAAERAREQDIVVYTIGYGRPDATDPADRVSVPLLTAVAGSPERTRVTPDAASLSSVFSEIAVDVVCQ